jgi:hypothetical protein
MKAQTKYEHATNYTTNRNKKFHKGGNFAKSIMSLLHVSSEYNETTPYATLFTFTSTCILLQAFRTDSYPCGNIITTQRYSDRGKILATNEANSLHTYVNIDRMALYISL